MALKIQFLLPEMKLGGAEKHVIYLAGYLLRKGYEVQITCLFKEGALAPVVKNLGIPLVCWNLPYRWNLRTFFHVKRRLQSSRPDILHTYLFGFHFFAGLPARLLKIPVILSSRREIADWQRKRHRILESLGNFFVDRVVCCSKAVEEWTRKKERISAGKILTIYNGVDFNRFHPSPMNFKIRKSFGIPENAPVLGTVANMAVEKGYPYLLEAADQISKANPNVWFLFVGFGPLEKEMKKKAEQIKAHKQIIFLGARSDIPNLLSAMDIFILASVIEGFPNVLLEAMASGKPVVATKAGGVPELIESGKDGLLVAPKNGPALAQAVLSLFGNRQKAEEFARSAEEKIQKNFSLEKMADQYETLYLSLLREKGIKESLETCAAL